MNHFDLPNITWHSYECGTGHHKSGKKTEAESYEYRFLRERDCENIANEWECQEVGSVAGSKLGPNYVIRINIPFDIGK